MMEELWEGAEKTTWELFEKLEREGKLSQGDAKDLEMLRYHQMTDPEFCLRAGCYKIFMFYYFNDYVGAPYCRLTVNRYRENGQRIFGEAYMIYPSGFNWTVEKDLLYLELEKEIEKCAEIKLDNRLRANRKAARKIAEDPRFAYFRGSFVYECLQDILNRWRDSKYYNDARNLCHCLLRASVQLSLRTNYVRFLHAMEAKFKFYGGIATLTGLIDDFDQLAGESGTVEFERDSLWHETMRKKIIDHFNAEEKMASWESIARSDYIRKKLDLAFEIGILCKDKDTGRYVEKYPDISSEDQSYPRPCIQLIKDTGRYVEKYPDISSEDQSYPRPFKQLICSG